MEALRERACATARLTRYVGNRRCKCHIRGQFRIVSKAGWRRPRACVCVCVCLGGGGLGRADKPHGIGTHGRDDPLQRRTHRNGVAFHSSIEAAASRRRLPQCRAGFRAGSSTRRQVCRKPGLRESGSDAPAGCIVAGPDRGQRSGSAGTSPTKHRSLGDPHQQAGPPAITPSAGIRPAVAAARPSRVARFWLCARRSRATAGPWRPCAAGRPSLRG